MIEKSFRRRAGLNLQVNLIHVHHNLTYYFLNRTQSPTLSLTETGYLKALIEYSIARHIPESESGSRHILSSSAPCKACTPGQTSKEIVDVDAIHRPSRQHFEHPQGRAKGSARSSKQSLQDRLSYLLFSSSRFKSKMTHPEQFTVDTEPIPLVDTVAEFTRHGEELINGIRQVAKSGKFILGPQVKELETALGLFVQNDDKEHPKVQCIGVSDGTTALQMCLMGLGIGRGHEVITVPFTWISSAEVIPLVGATPVFADIEADTFVMDAEQVAPLISANTRAVITVSLYGIIPDLRRIRQVLDEAQEKFGTDIALIEDGAQSFGSIRQGYRSCGSPHATLSTTSFFPTKPLSCYGDGGAVFTRDEKLADRLRAIRVHGKVNGSHVMVGLNARLDTLQAAVLLSKLTFFQESLSARQKAAEVYTDLFREDERIVVPSYTRITNDDGMKSAYGVYTIQVQQRDEVVKRMKQAGIGCAVYYSKCCHKQPIFASPQELPVSESMSSKVLSLPIHPYLNVKQQRRIVQVLRTILDDLGISQR